MTSHEFSVYYGYVSGTMTKSAAIAALKEIDTDLAKTFIIRIRGY